MPIKNFCVEKKEMVSDHCQIDTGCSEDNQPDCEQYVAVCCVFVLENQWLIVATGKRVTYMSMKLCNVFSCLCLGILLGISGVVLADSWEGVWVVTDSGGKPFKITLSKDGLAVGRKIGKEGLKGTWKQDAGAIEIYWDSGWTTRMEMQGDKCKKTAFKPGASLSGPPTNRSGCAKTKKEE
jgi:hypothetical protein